MAIYGGWVTYSKYKLESIAPMDTNWSSDSTQAYTFWAREFNKRLSLCFSKKTVKMEKTQHRTHTANNSVRNILASMAKKGKIQRNIVKKYMERVIELETRQEAVFKAYNLKQTMKNLTQDEKFSPSGN